MQYLAADLQSRARFVKAYQSPQKGRKPRALSRRNLREENYDLVKTLFGQQAGQLRRTEQAAQRRDAALAADDSRRPFRRQPAAAPDSRVRIGTDAQSVRRGHKESSAAAQHAARLDQRFRLIF